MIALLTGEVAVRRTDHVVVSCAGVGYRLAVSAETLRHTPAVGKPATLHTHLIVRDDALLLFGFSSEAERDLFLMLIGVQSVGPKVALAVLSGGAPRELLAAVAAGDTARLQAVPGIGKRTAERIVVELREKVGAAPDDDPIVVARGDDPRLLARDGLVGLGFSPVEAEQLLDGAPGETPEDLIAHALQGARGGEHPHARRRPAPDPARARRRRARRDAPPAPAARSSSARRSCKRAARVSIAAARRAATRSTTCCSPARPASARPASRGSSPRSSASRSSRPPARRWSARATSRRS